MRSNIFPQIPIFLPLLHLWSLSVKSNSTFFGRFSFLSCRKIRITPHFSMSGPSVGFVCRGFLIFRLDRSAGFYFTPFRVYQFGLGALVFCIERRWLVSVFFQRAMQVSGLALCAIAVVALGPISRFIGLASGVGAAFIIYGGCRGAFFAPLANPIAGYLGRISYSLYLVHWPITVFASYIYGNQAFGYAGLFVQVALMLTLAAFMYHFVERPFLRKRDPSHKTPTIVVPVVVASVLIAISVTVLLEAAGTGDSIACSELSMSLRLLALLPARGKSVCSFGVSSSSPDALLIGDSYAQHYIAGIDRIAKDLELRVDEHIQHGCLVLSGLLRIGYPDERCRTGRDRILTLLKQGNTPVIISEAWMGYLDGSVGDDSARRSM